MKKGLIFNIQRFSIHDGPGIRTVVFLKGCPLRCIWCSNPESQSTEPEMMFSHMKCVGCGECIKVCESNAIKVVDNKIVDVRDNCINCGKCVEACPTGARKMAGTQMSVSEVVKEVKKDQSFYRRSGGGVTLSGGEPIIQGEFVKQLVKALKSRNIHVAIETTGFAEWQELWEIVKDVDLILYDLKAYKRDKHKQSTKVDNRMILDNAKKIAKLKDVIFRVPIIPGYNDEKESLEQLAYFIKSCNPNGRVHILPYHSLGKPKYKGLGREYEVAEVNPPSEEELKTLAAIFSNIGLETEIY